MTSAIPPALWTNTRIRISEYSPILCIVFATKGPASTDAPEKTLVFAAGIEASLNVQNTSEYELYVEKVVGGIVC
jgi:hypothetical protein